MLKIIGEHPLATDEAGHLKCRIATIFLSTSTIVTLPGIHATQRVAYSEAMNQQRRAGGLPPLSEAEELAEWDNSVDLIMEDNCIFIRPDPERMDLAFAADELLQESISKLRIKFLLAFHGKVRDAIKRRGEYWRIAALPQTPAEMKRMILASRLAIGGRPIYYYSKTTGTRYLTCQDFSQLAALDDESLRFHLLEIQRHSCRSNRLGRREVDFFGVEGLCASANLAAYDFRAMAPEPLRAAHAAMAERFRQAVGATFQRDDVDDLEWRNAMYKALVGQGEPTVQEESRLGLGAEFFMQIEWLPGMRIEAGELIPDSIHAEAANGTCGNVELLADEKPQAFIFNLVREYGDLEYVNIGRVNASLSRRSPLVGRRGVYIAEVKVRGAEREMVQIIRLQKWGVREHLDEGKSLLAAMIESEEYTDYILDRRLGCRQLGMNLPPRIVARRISEVYRGVAAYTGARIWTSYLERDYIHGIASDKMPAHKLQDREFALRFARLLGRAAAPNAIVGRADLGGAVIFDDGDEVVIEDEQGLPREIVISDPTGTFVDYRNDLNRVAAAYARPVRSRMDRLADVQAFAEAYVESFIEHFREVQQEYRKRRQAFDTLFRHRPNNEGSFACRWEQVLLRLDHTDPQALGQAIREHIKA